MKVVHQLTTLYSEKKETEDRGLTTGFVPTMGAFHRGHLSLIERSREENQYTIVSIFVNPTQFNDKEDFERYPRQFSKDLEVVEPFMGKDDLLFIPSIAEIYPEKDLRQFDLGGLDKVMEGVFRPGHFNGVSQVVTRLFDLVKPQRAYFGEKDFQQLTIIKHLVKQLGIPVEIISCPTIREADGLAMSSRNMLLNPELRKAAAEIPRTLRLAAEQADTLDIPSLKAMVKSRIRQFPLLRLEYFEIVNDTDLKPVSCWSEFGGKVGCIAVKAGKVRLIDNVRFNS